MRNFQILRSGTYDSHCRVSISKLQLILFHSQYYIEGSFQILLQNAKNLGIDITNAINLRLLRELSSLILLPRDEIEECFRQHLQRSPVLTDEFRPILEKYQIERLRGVVPREYSCFMRWRQMNSVPVMA